MEANANFKQNQSSSLVVDKGKGWGEQIRDKADELERGMQGDKILFTRKCRLSLWEDIWNSGINKVKSECFALIFV